MHRFFLLAGLLISSSLVQAEEGFSTPVGVMKVTVAASTGAGRAATGLSVPLEKPSRKSGQMEGTITSLTSNTISNSLAGWTPGELSSAPSPTLIRITSGPAKGRTFIVSTSSPNTSSTLTIDANDLGTTNLAWLGVTTGDTYQLLQAHTLAILFGTDSENGILAGTNPNLCDQVQLMVGGAYRTYYLSTSAPRQWRRVGPNTGSNNIIIRPDTGVVFSRLANTPLELTFLGTVPTLQRIADVTDGGSTTLSVGWAADTTIAGLGLDSLPTWTSGGVATADTVQFLVGGVYRTYYHDGNNWRRVGPNTISNTVTIPAGTVYVITQRGTATSSNKLTQTPPYSL